MTDWDTQDVTPQTDVRPPSLAERVHAVIRDCLYGDPLPPNAEAEALRVEGVVSNFGLDPKQVAANKAKIEALIDEIVPDPFYADKGGGMSFLALCETKTGEQWGEHRSMEALYVLAAAIGRARFCAPKAMWVMFPGGMPYLQFDRKA